MKHILRNLSQVVSSNARFLPLALLLDGAFFRIVYPGNFSFGFDQAQILDHAHNILDADISLIGPRTGPANMFTGPLIYYLSAPIVLLLGDAKAVAVVPLLLSLVTGIVLYLVTKRYLDTQAAAMAITIWAFSPFLVSLDRTFWNPNLMLLATVFMFVPLLKDKTTWLTYVLLFGGSFLSYQAHFSGFLLVALSLASVFLLRKPKKLSAPIIAGLGISLVPTLIFDLRNNFLNARGLLSLFAEKHESSVVAVVSDIVHNFFVIAETLGKLFIYGNSTPTIVVIGVAFLLLGFLLYQKKCRLV
jgi:hypothetical protein